MRGQPLPISNFIHQPPVSCLIDKPSTIPTHVQTLLMHRDPTHVTSHVGGSGTIPSPVNDQEVSHINAMRKSAGRLTLNHCSVGQL
jgi:hypothetical protein